MLSKKLPQGLKDRILDLHNEGINHDYPIISALLIDRPTRPDNERDELNENQRIVSKIQSIKDRPGDDFVLADNLINAIFGKNWDLISYLADKNSRDQVEEMEYLLDSSSGALHFIDKNPCDTATMFFLEYTSDKYTKKQVSAANQVFKALTKHTPDEMIIKYAKDLEKVPPGGHKPKPVEEHDLGEFWREENAFAM